MGEHLASRYHDFSYGHRVVGHENKCRHLHGHNGRVHFHCQASPGSENLDNIGRVIDFTAIKEKLCMWVEDNWDHKFLAWENDSLINGIFELLDKDENEGPPYVVLAEEDQMFRESIIWTPFNPTAENMAQYLVNVIGPKQLQDTGVILVKCTIEETAKCSATYSIG